MGWWQHRKLNKPIRVKESIFNICVYTVHICWKRSSGLCRKEGCRKNGCTLPAWPAWPIFTVISWVDFFSEVAVALSRPKGVVPVVRGGGTVPYAAYLCCELRSGVGHLSQKRKLRFWITNTICVDIFPNLCSRSHDHSRSVEVTLLRQELRPATRDDLQ